MRQDGTPEFAIDVRGLGKSFAGRKVVDDFSIRVRRGQIFGFLGPNGSGKTTTIRLLCGLLTPDAGEGTCLGFDLRREAGAIKRRVGYMTQRFSLYEDLSVRENLEFVARIYALDDRPRRVERALERLGLLERQEQLAGTLSGGWKQRLALSACLLHEPELLLLDEPTAGVDPKARREFWDELHLLAAHGMTVLVSTHYMDEAERCHEIAYIAFGKLMLHGPIEQVRRAAGLTTWVASGPNVARIAAEIAGLPGIEIVAPFGAQIHVSGTDAGRMAASLARHRDTPGLEWRQIEPGLEDVFIHTMRRARDNFQ